MVRVSRLFVCCVLFAGVTLAYGETASFRKAKLYSASAELVSTSSEDWENIFSETLRLKKRGCIAAIFNAEVVMSGGRNGHIRCLIDGEEATPPNTVVGSADGVQITASANFWKCDVGKGSHEVRIQFRATYVTEMKLNFRSLILLYNK